jgi:polysaccharide biosynthesis protein PslH
VRVTIIDGDVAYPPTSGKRLRTLHLMTRLARHHHITYIARSDETSPREACDYFKSYGIEPHLVHAPLPAKTGLQFYGRLLANVATSEPYSVQTHTLAPMRAAVRAHAAASVTDLWQLEWSGYRYCLAPTDGPFVLQAHNVDALIWQRYHEVEVNWSKRLYIAEQWRKFRAFEGAAFRSADRIVAVSAQDRSEAHRLYGSDLAIDIVPNGVETAAFSGVTPDSSSRTILFLGALDWRPNLDGLSHLLATTMDQVRARVPGCRLLVVGRHPSADLRQKLAQLPWVTLAADVPDVRPYLAQCAVLAVPLRIGGGTRLKILEALAAGLPVVSTTVGAEGLDVVDDAHVDIADAPQSFADRLVTRLKQSALAEPSSLAARRALAEHYDWRRQAERLDATWHATLASRPSMGRAA